ncbi:MAG: hypothetical protein A2887_00875 [Alphaproteobacteria bacterium RIFCSPLOWO2_01_FULL_40_26]|nr:MAG: hypothetical protein A3D15_04580 [Alphaproteobacteria bacterium RIFCSPHIGHO2_02_FULL_40_34]OFW86488.1 MAG: hypothetical protein A2794_04825 [Alphaproteobacteria bacterium RIFCSPHIGHO2_01_FULL_40_8]OFW95452.1 MAG: hypothetical protein A2887_00875 [Alphaproteobacteria bacterium RIFCSPLOWO2_01_FULL_40_26]OFX10257.1 MAG: hypothetical protein A3H30_00855 [Alphaproteobacteria bacterium RIFCSPLOWO2_02_FULL_40_19]OFX11510.1 MAG: hypothetical protein A3G22_04735 [Alphaproteobacteria bacterium RI
MKNLAILVLILCAVSCAKKHTNPLIVPPNFAELPDPNNPEKPTATQQEEDVARLKELLLKSEE